MEVVWLFSAIIAVMALIAFVSGRRFGILALGLSASSILVLIWSGRLSGLLADYGLTIQGLPPGALAIVILLLLPIIPLLLKGPKYKGKFERISSALFAGVLAAAFLVVPLGGFLALEGDSLSIYRLMLEYWQLVVTAGVVMAVIDLFMLHSKKSPVPDKKH